MPTVVNSVDLDGFILVRDASPLDAFPRIRTATNATARQKGANCLNSNRGNTKWIITQYYGGPKNAQGFRLETLRGSPDPA